MDIEEYTRRRDRAVASLRRQIASIDGITRARLVNVFDTKAGSGEHSYLVEQRRRSNAMVERQPGIITGTLYDYIEDLQRCSDTTQIWAWLHRELRPVAVYSECGGIDWSQWWRNLEASSTASEYDRQYGRALQAVYSCFWV